LRRMTEFEVQRSDLAEIPTNTPDAFNRVYDQCVQEAERVERLVRGSDLPPKRCNRVRALAGTAAFFINLRSATSRLRCPKFLISDNDRENRLLVLLNYRVLQSRNT